MTTKDSTAGIEMARSEEPFVFISYAHKDMAQALSIISMLQQANVTLWYDKGIDPGSEWDDNIAEHISACGCMICVVSRNYLASDNCKDELKYARDLQKEILIVYIEECTLPSGIALRINRKQAIMKHRYAQEDDFRAELLHANVLKKYIASAPGPREEAPAPARPSHSPALAQIVDGDELQLGYLANDGVTAIGVKMDDLLRRMLICAPADEQRRRFLCRIMLNLYQNNGSFIIFSSGASQYRSMLSIVPDLQIFTPGKESLQPFPFNPFIAKETRRLPLGQMITRIAHTLQLTLGLPPKAHTVLIMAIRQCVRRFGMQNHDVDTYWDEETVRRFSLRDVLQEYKRLVQEHYQGDEAAELMSICNDQLQEFMNQNGDVLDRVYSTPITSLAEVPTLIEMDAMPGIESRALLTRMLLHYIYLLCKNSELVDLSKRLIILIDDVNMLLDTGDAEIDSVQLISRQVALRHLLHELESTGKISLICVTDSLHLFDRHLLQDMANKVVIGEAYTGSEELLRQLGAGSMSPACSGNEGILLSGRPPVTFVPDQLDEHFCASISDEDVGARVCYWEGNQKLLRRYLECEQCTQCSEDCDFAIRETVDEVVLRGLFRKIDDVAAITDDAPVTDRTHAALIEKQFEAYLASCLEKLPLTSVPGNKQRYVSCLRIRLAKELAARAALHIPLSRERINQLTPAMLADASAERAQIPVGLDASGHRILTWDIGLNGKRSQQCFAIRWADSDVIGAYEDELAAVLQQVQQRVGHLCVLSWEERLLRGKGFSHILARKQAVDQLATLYTKEVVQRAKAYKEAPEALEAMEEQTWVIHISRELLEHLPDNVYLKPLTHFKMPIRMRFIYLISSHVNAQVWRDYGQLIPAENAITFGFESLSESKAARKALITGTVTAEGRPEDCRFISL